MLDASEVLINPERVAKHKRALDAWRDLKVNHKSLTLTVLELLRHPDATDEQVRQVRDVYRRSYEQVKSAQQRMREKYGSRSWIEDMEG